MTSPTPNHRWYHLTPARFFIGLLAVQVFLLLSERFQWFAFNEEKGWTVLVAVGVVIGAVLLMLMWGLLCLCLRRRFQFSYRSLLLFLVAVSIPLGWFTWEMQRARRQREVVERIVELEGMVYYDYQWDDKSAYWVEGGEPTTPAWLRELLGDDLFCDVKVVACGSKSFGNIEAGQLKRLTKLKMLDLVHTEISDDGLEHLAALTDLTALFLHHTQITDAGLVHLEKLTRLKWLVLDGTQVSDPGLLHLREIDSLESLSLACTHVTEAGLEHLGGLTNLQTLDLSGTKVADEGVKELQQALPNCEIRQ